MPLGNMFAYKLPKAVADVNVSRNAVPGSHCSEYTIESSCKSDPACGWCTSGQGKCFAVQRSQACASDFRTEACQGLCGILTQCSSCLVWGEAKAHCGWCVQDSRCYPQHSQISSCKTPDKGWWGSAKFLTRLDQCLTADFPPGLTVVSYKDPPNNQLPDDVALISIAMDRFVRTEKEHVASKHYLGYIYPFIQQSPPWKNYILKVIMTTASKSQVDLMLSEDDTREKAVSNHVKVQSRKNRLPRMCRHTAVYH